MRVRATVADTPQLRWWLLGFGDAVTVQAPAELRQWFAQTAVAMAASYAAWAGAQGAAIEARRRGTFIRERSSRASLFRS